MRPKLGLPPQLDQAVGLFLIWKAPRHWNVLNDNEQEEHHVGSDKTKIVALVCAQTGRDGRVDKDASLLNRIGIEHTQSQATVRGRKE